jgi:hypothetical protein
MSKSICPFCFEEMDSHEIWFQCTRSDCAEQVFPAARPNALQRLFGVGNPVEARCPACYTAATTRACPHCYRAFPHGMDGLSNIVIAIIGAKETGKSHYIAVLIQQIYNLYNQFDWSLMAMDDETMRLYNDRFHRPLYMNRKTIRVTMTAKSDADVRKPLLYSLSTGCYAGGTRAGNRFKTVTLAFFDTAGEDMDDEIAMRAINPYIYNASGIILLLDPLQIKNLREQIDVSLNNNTNADVNMPGLANTSVGDIINKTSNLIYTKRRISHTRTIPIPLAVVFSKIDMLKPVLGDDAPIYQPSRHRGFFNIREFENNDAFVRNWVGEFDRRFIQGVRHYRETAFFGASALGGNPTMTGDLPFEPRPIRVEDPFLWLLWKNGFIQGR